MRISRIAVPVAAAVCALLTAGPAAAQPQYPPSPPTLTVSPATVFVGDVVQEFGRGFAPNELVRIEISFGGGSAGGTGGGGSVQPGRMAGFTAHRFAAPIVRADSAGSFTSSDRMTRVGTATITATGTTSGLSDSATVTVLAPVSAALPRTSSTPIDLGRILLASGAALTIGAVLVLLSLARRRRPPSIRA